MLTGMSDVLRVAQLSDTHFREADAEPEGTHGYDTSEAFDAVADHLGQRDDIDLVVVTGDVADHGRPAQYELASTALTTGLPVRTQRGRSSRRMFPRCIAPRSSTGVAADRAVRSRDRRLSPHRS